MTTIINFKKSIDNVSQNYTFKKTITYVGDNIFAHNSSGNQDEKTWTSYVPIVHEERSVSLTLKKIVLLDNSVEHHYKASMFGGPDSTKTGEELIAEEAAKGWTFIESVTKSRGIPYTGY